MVVFFVIAKQQTRGQETWLDNDIGTVGIAGSSSYNSSTDSFTVNGAGSGVGSTSDSCHLVSEALNGDLEIIAHVASIQNTNAAATSGLMIRESTAAGAISAYVAVTPSDGVRFITRSSTNGSSSTTTVATSQTAPVWIRLVRSNSSTPGDYILTGYYSTDGASWTQVGTATIAMANNVLMGMAVSSNTTAQTASSGIDHVDAMINVPQQSSSLVAWYRADVGVVQSINSVSQWQDQSGNGNNASQATGSKQPALEAATLNGQPVLHFTHANSTYMSVASASDLNMTKTTIFAISRNSGTTGGTILSRISSVVDYVMAYYIDTEPRLYINSAAYYAQGSLSSNTWAVLQGEYDQTDISLHVNGTLTQTAHTTAIGSSAQPLYIGGLSTSADTADSDLAELLIFNTALTTTQNQQIEGYLYTKYGVGVNPLPVISSLTTATGTVGSSFSYTITASNSPTSFYATGLPSGLSVNTSTGAITGTPTTTGSYYVTISATNAAGTGSAVLTLTINSAAPVITSSTTATGTQGQSFGYTITATNSPTSFNATGLPTGLSVNSSTGSISGTPTENGSYPVTISATNTYGTGTATLALTINPPPPVITSGTTASGTVGQAFSYTITGSNSPASYSVTGLLPGLNINTATGLISGAPTAAGPYSVVIGATNAGGTGTETLTVTINPPPPVITSANSASGTVGLPFSYAIMANGAPTSFSATGLPAGLSINTATGVIGGTPTTAGTSTITLGATNAGGTGSATLTLTNSSPPTPVITSGTTASGDVGVSFNYTILASNNPTSFSATGLPSGLTFNSSTGLISGTPTSTGTSTVSLGATNAGGTGTATLTLAINGASAPVITSVLAGNIFTGTAYSYTITATNGPTSFSATGLPAGLSLSSGTGVISGTPTGSGYSSIPVTISASNAAGTGAATLLLTLNLPAPVISSATSASGSVGAAFSYAITASNNPTTFSASGLPSGLSIDVNTGVISGAPLSAGTSEVTIGATNAGGTGSVTLTLTIGEPVPVPVINSGTVASGSVGAAFSYGITTSTVPAPTSYGATGLPSGLSVNTSTGVISGTPTTSATSTVTLSATNSDGTGNATLILTINPSGAPVITSSTTATITAGASFNYTITASNNPSSFSASGLPSPLTLNTATGQITGTPSAAGAYSVILSASNASGTGNSTIALTVNPPVPVITSAATANGTFGVTITSPYVIAASNSPTTFGATNLPPGLIVNAYTGAITGTPTMAGTWTTVISATNAGGTGTADLTFTIAAGGSSPIATRSVASGDYRTLLLKSDGTVWAAGYNADAELGDGGTASSPSYVKVSGLSGIIAVASGGYTSMALDSSGHVWTWGNGYYGQLGNGTNGSDSGTPVEVSGLNSIIAIAGGEYFNMALDSNGHVWAWGEGYEGELGNPSDTTYSNVPVEVETSSGYLSGVTAIACEGYSGMAVRSDGTVWVWGLDNEDQLGDESGTNSFQAKEVFSGGTPLSGIVAVAGGSDYGLALTSAGTIWGWGDESDGYLGNGVSSGNTASPSTGPVQVINSNGEVFHGVTAISGRGDHTLALLNDGSVWSWGQNDFGQLGIGSVSAYNSTPVRAGNLTNVQAIAAGESHSVALKSDGTIWGWGYNEDASDFGAGTTGPEIDLPAPVAGLSGITAIAGDKAHYLALTSSGTVLTWNDTTPGEISDGTNITGSSTPVPVSGLTGVTITAIACGSYFNLALDNSGKVWAWGQNSHGQLGNGTNTDSQTPVQVMTASGALSGITAIACAGYAGLALDSSGHVWTWGENYYGELGNSDSAYQDTNLAAQISTLSGITAISAGPFQVAALGAGGAVWMWGFNVGSGGSYNPGYPTDTPTSVSGLSGITAISVNYGFDLALSSSGTIYAWGDNSDGVYGNGSTTSTSTFTAVTGLTNIAALGSGGDASHVVVRKTDGTLWAWGDNTSGQLGVGSYGAINASPSPTGSNAPVAVLGLNGVTITSLVFGKDSTVALTDTGTVFQWGDGSYEPKGFSVPVQVDDLLPTPSPVISPPAGSYTSSQTIAISTTLSGTIHYTLDGTTPTASSPTYTGSFTLSGDALVSAVVINGGSAVSPIASSQFFINDPSETALPTVPTGLTVTPVSSSEIDLSWSLSGTANYSLIGIYRSSDGGLTYQLIAILDPSATSYDDTTVQAGSHYQYYVATINDSGQSDTSASSSVTPTTPNSLTITLTTPSGAEPLP